MLEGQILFQDFDPDQMLETARHLLDAEWRMDISKRPFLSSFLAEDCGVRHFTIEAVDSVLSLHYRYLTGLLIRAGIQRERNCD